MLSAGLEQLIAALDPKRNYGELSYEALVEGVRAGWINLLEVEPGKQPFITNALTGHVMKGTASRHPAAFVKPGMGNKRMFLQRAVTDFDRMYEALVELAVNGQDPRAMKIWWEHFLGQPARSIGDGASQEVVEIMRALATGPQRVEYIDAETGEARA